MKGFLELFGFRLDRLDGSAVFGHMAVGGGPIPGRGAIDFPKPGLDEFLDFGIVPDVRQGCACGQDFVLALLDRPERRLDVVAQLWVFQNLGHAGINLAGIVCLARCIVWGRGGPVGASGRFRPLVFRETGIHFVRHQPRPYFRGFQQLRQGRIVAGLKVPGHCADQRLGSGEAIKESAGYLPGSGVLVEFPGQLGFQALKVLATLKLAGQLALIGGREQAYATDLPQVHADGVVQHLHGLGSFWLALGILRLGLRGGPIGALGGSLCLGSIPLLLLWRDGHGGSARRGDSVAVLGCVVLYGVRLAEDVDDRIPFFGFLLRGRFEKVLWIQFSGSVSVTDHAISLNSLRDQAH